MITHNRKMPTENKEKKCKQKTRPASVNKEQSWQCQQRTRRRKKNRKEGQQVLTFNRDSQYQQKGRENVNRKQRANVNRKQGQC